MSEKQKQPEAYNEIYDTGISLGILATRFRCGGTSDYDFIRNVLLSLAALTEFSKVVNIRRSYGKES